MAEEKLKIGLGGGCHWCTEGVFQSLKGVHKVEQGWIASEGDQHSFSEAVIVHYDPAKISLSVLIEIHLHTHASTSDHSMRDKYRSAIYYFDASEEAKIKQFLKHFQKDFEQEIVTKVYPFKEFKSGKREYADYYYTNPEKSFCKSYIQPKIRYLIQHQRSFTNWDKVKKSGGE